MSGTSVWFRFYNNVAHDPKVQRLSGDKFKAWVNMLCVASEKGGVLPNIADLSYALRMSEQEVGDLLDEFYRLELIDEIEVEGGPMGYTPHNWSARQFKSDVSTERVKRFRETKRNVSSTKTETLITEHSKAEQTKSNKAASPSKDENFEQFKRNYPRRAGSYGWKAADRKYLALVKTGVDPIAINAAAARYAEEMRKLNRIGTEFVKMPTPWLNSEDFSEVAAAALDEIRPLDWDSVVSFYKRTAVWSKHAGSDPTSPSCRAPPEILRKYGIEPISTQ